MAIVVRMTWEQVERAAEVGVKRRIDALKKGRKDRYGMSEDGPWTVDVEGSGGELVSAQYTGLPWNDFLEDVNPKGKKLADVGDFIDARTRSKDWYELIVHPEDCDDWAFVLVTGRIPLLTLRGWRWGSESKQERWWKDPTGKNLWAFFVPQKELRPMESLLEVVQERQGKKALPEPEEKLVSRCRIHGEFTGWHCQYCYPELG